MSRRIIDKTKMNWQPATQSKPSQGDRVLLKVALDGDEMHVVGWWSGEWEVCEQLMRVEDDELGEVLPDFTEDDVLAYAYFI